MTQASNNFLALDVGTQRIGLAVASSVARLPRPLMTIKNDQDSLKSIQNIIDQEEISTLVIGLPRNLSGDDTDQTKLVRNFGEQLHGQTGLKINWQDEALTSKKAESELRDRGVAYNREHVDSLAATYILSDFLSDQREDKSA